MLLPGGDADHHGVIGNAVGFDIEVVVVESGLDEGGEVVERGGLFGGENWRAFCVGWHRMGSVGMLAYIVSIGRVTETDAGDEDFD